MRARFRWLLGLCATVLAIALTPHSRPATALAGPMVTGTVNPGQTVLSQLGTGTTVTLSAPLSTKVCFFGDSGIANGGITNTKPGGPPGMMGPLMGRLRLAGDDYTPVGAFATARPGDNANQTPSRYQWPTSPWNDGVSGNKITDVNARAASEIAAFPALCNVAFVWIGINDMCAGNTSATMTSNLTTLAGTMRSAFRAYDSVNGGRTIIVFGTVGPAPATCSGTCSGSSCPTVRTAYNAAILGSWISGMRAIDPYVFSYDAAGDYTGSYTGQVAGALDSHHDEYGYLVDAQRAADWLLFGPVTLKPIRSGLPFPRAIHKMPPEASVRLISSSDAVQMSMPTNMTSESYAVAFDFMAASVPANGSFTSIAGRGWAYDSGSDGAALLLRGNTTAGNYADLYLYSGSGSEVALAVGAIDVGQWHRIVWTYHSVEGLMTIWIDGVFASSYAKSAPTVSATHEFLLGKTLYFGAAPGLYNNFHVLDGTSTPLFWNDAMRQAVEGDWFEAKLLSASAHASPFMTYALNDGSGNAPAEASLGTAACLGSMSADACTPGGGSFKWVAAGIAPKTDPRTGALRETGTWAAPPARALLQWGASASVTTASAQYIPPWSGSATSTTDSTLGVLIAGTARPISSMQYQFTGSSSNVGGQTITVTLLLNGSAITGASVASIASTSGNKTGTVTFSPIEVFPSDVITASVTPSSSLTAALSDVMVSVQGVSPVSLLLAVASLLRRLRGVTAANDNACRKAA